MKKLLTGIFAYSNSMQSYKKPIFKLILFPIVTTLLFFRPKSGVAILDGVVSIVAIVVEFFTILYCLYIPVTELFSVAANRKKIKKTIPYKLLSVDQIGKLCLNNDIIDFEISLNGEPIHIGSSSESKPYEIVFTNKRFYIDSIEYLDYSVFIEEIKRISEDGYLKVSLIDDVATESWGDIDC